MTKPTPHKLRDFAWRRLPAVYRLTTVCVFSGFIIGSATTLLNIILSFIARHITSHLGSNGANFAFLILPVFGFVVTALFVKYIIRTPLNHGTERLKTYLHSRDHVLSARIMWSPVLAASVTLGFGGSAGGEGPSAFAGAAIGTNLGRWFGLDQDQLRILIGIGAGAGIAGIFRSPLGGVLFTLEVLRMPMRSRDVIPLIAGCLVAGTTSFVFAGDQFDISFFNSVPPMGRDMPYIILLGVLVGFYSVYYTFVMDLTERLLEALKSVWVRAISAGLMTGLAIFIFPSLFSTGYPSLDRLLASDYSVLLSYSAFAGADGEAILLAVIALGIAVIKPFVCAAANYGGGVAGNYAPTLFAGGFFGFAFAVMMNTWCGCELPVPNFIFLGAAAAMSGIISAPMMSIFLAAEMANRSDFLLSLAVIALVSWIVRTISAPRLRPV
ncbi:MAG: chloride channel protein [Muribaculum sp.]|nr:chloride channel protein [Muribaculum sp.]